MNQWVPWIILAGVVAWMFRDQIMAWIGKTNVVPIPPPSPEDQGKMTPEEVGRFIAFCDTHNLPSLRDSFIAAVIPHIKAR